MFIDFRFTKENLDTYLKELGKEYRRMSGTKIPAEVILVGGAAILAQYGFRDMTYDIDAIIYASSVIKDAVNSVGDKLGLPAGWLNMDFESTKSYTEKLVEVSEYYGSFSNILRIRVITGEYLIAMKLMSGRRYKNDLSDIIGILCEHQKNGCPITIDSVNKAVKFLYGGWENIPKASKDLIDAVIHDGDYENTYQKIINNEKNAKDILLSYIKDNPGLLHADSKDRIIEMARKKKESGK